ncbi:MAG: potassium ABC transporter ATPase [Proteobacteria bacterium]|nr:potassium ABC transporter ATPase [Pseudomonadota bacterium]
MDIVYLGAAALFFLLLIGLVVGCDRLGARS